MRNICETLQMIADDCENDAASLDGMELTGRNVGERFGQHLAMIRGVALLLKQHIEETERARDFVAGMGKPIAATEGLKQHMETLMEVANRQKDAKQ